MNHACGAWQWRLFTESMMWDRSGHRRKGLLLRKKTYWLAHFQEVQLQRLLGLTQNNKSGDQCGVSQGATFQRDVLEGGRGAGWDQMRLWRVNKCFHCANISFHLLFCFFPINFEQMLKITRLSFDYNNISTGVCLSVWIMPMCRCFWVSDPSGTGCISFTIQCPNCVDWPRSCRCWTAQDLQPCPAHLQTASP